MAKTDVFGFFKPTTFTLKQVKPKLSYFAILLLRTELTELELLIKLQQECNYLFSVSPHYLPINCIGKRLFRFPVYLDSEEIEKDMLLIIKNHAIENNDCQLIAYDDKGIFQLIEKQQKLKIQQLSLQLEDENEEDDSVMDVEGELERWKEMKRKLKEKSLHSLGRIDFVIPISVYIYEHFLGLLNSLHLISEIQYCYKEASALENFDDFYYYLTMYKDNILQEKEQKRKEDIEIFKMNNEIFI
ncbi:MAG: hypothetical protein ACOXZH_09295 [Bacteroidales bacterium]|jgi:hypothetical protein|nr:hypothetical protein [Bacteroidales bacterium]